PAHYPTKRFGVEVLAERGRPCHVAKDDRHGLPHFACLLDRERRAARVTEPRIFRILLSADATEHEAPPAPLEGHACSPPRRHCPFPRRASARPRRRRRLPRGALRVAGPG